MKPLFLVFVILAVSSPALAAKAKKPAPHAHASRVLMPEPNAIYFSGLGSTLDAAAIKKLTAFSAGLSKHHWSEIQLIGHAYRCRDAKVCFAIQSQRNNAVKSFLVKRGVKPYKINTIAFGDSIHPGPGDTPAAQALEQKVEIILK
jgi:outer membrane protein OmpA-like peptidoglycan-associated protein